MEEEATLLGPIAEAPEEEGIVLVKTEKEEGLAAEESVERSSDESITNDSIKNGKSEETSDVDNEKGLQDTSVEKEPASALKALNDKEGQTSENNGELNGNVQKEESLYDAIKKSVKAAESASKEDEIVQVETVVKEDLSEKPAIKEEPSVEEKPAAKQEPVKEEEPAYNEEPAAKEEPTANTVEKASTEESSAKKESTVKEGQMIIDDPRVNKETSTK